MKFSTIITSQSFKTDKYLIDYIKTFTYQNSPNFAKVKYKIEIYYHNNIKVICTINDICLDNLDLKALELRINRIINFT